VVVLEERMRVLESRMDKVEVKVDDMREDVKDIKKSQEKFLYWFVGLLGTSILTLGAAVITLLRG